MKYYFFLMKRRKFHIKFPKNIFLCQKILKKRQKKNKNFSLKKRIKGEKSLKNDIEK